MTEKVSAPRAAVPAQALPAPGRIYLFDNLKAVLIFLVLLGHLIEPRLGGLRTYAYTLIYSFHMPLFVLCSGCFARFEPRRLLTKILYPYAVFQTIYWFFLQRPEGISLSFFTPYWILWYLLSLFFWTLVLPFAEGGGRRRRRGILVLAFGAGILAGVDGSAGYLLSLSRTIAFFPFFWLGHCLRQSPLWTAAADPGKARGRERSWLWPARLLFAALALGGALWLYKNQYRINPTWLHCSFGYGVLEYKPLYRVLHYGMALVFAGAALAWTPRKRLWFTYLGERSLQVYLLHGFLVKLAVKYDLYQYVGSHLLAWCIVTAAALSLILAALPISRLAGPFMAWPFHAGQKEKKNVEQ